MKIKTSVVEDLFESEDTTFSEDRGWRFVATALKGTGRWDSRHWLILEHEETGEFWAISYSMGLTENQDHDFPWREMWSKTPDELDLFRVFPKAVATIEWKEWKDQ